MIVYLAHGYGGFTQDGRSGVVGDEHRLMTMKQRRAEPSKERGGYLEEFLYIEDAQ